ncbi:DUF535 domain-containing protein [Escherichia coli]|nr:DUF535 domain-containing protein [Escherichia coli]EET2643531.1 DUF535 domain-containing protein [Escherichia coli]EFG8619616.1 DUF535 domain-containing protein [Escherichia coli]EGE6913983.1 DUF535 domain-containing protein [Escherichia coli]ELP7220507.1 DUF535 domain-containing protein [Escherichia coli]
MYNQLFSGFLMVLLFKPQKLSSKWKKTKFRYMYILRCLIYPVISIKHYNELKSLKIYDDMISRQPLLPAKIHRPYLHKGGKIKQRSQYILQHYRFVQELPAEKKDVLFPLDEYILAAFSGKNNEEIKICCSSCSFDREGELMLTLLFNNIPVCRISFTIVRFGMNNVFFIGGLQGPPKNIEHQVIRISTKSCYGLYPKRIIFEALTVLASLCDIEQIYAVSENSHVFKQLRYRRQKKNSFVALYSDFWCSIGGVKYKDLYKLPVDIKRKSLCDIASKRCAEYKRRYDLLDKIRMDIINVVSGM